MVFLNSKVDHIWGHNDKGNEIFKTSSKGMQGRNNLIRQDFLDLLLERTEHIIENAGFINNGAHTYTNTPRKKGLNYFYCKTRTW